MSLRNQLLHVIERTTGELPPAFDDDTSLIRSGRLDSTGLFEVALWIEERIDPSVQLTSFDLSEEWDTVAKMLAFVERHRR